MFNQLDDRKYNLWLVGNLRHVCEPMKLILDPSTFIDMHEIIVLKSFLLIAQWGRLWCQIRESSML